MLTPDRERDLLALRTRSMMPQFKAVQNDFNLELGKAARDVLTNGPESMLTALSTPTSIPLTFTPADKARKCYGIVPTTVFLRWDGWTLGVPKHLEEDAVVLGKFLFSWIAIMRDYQHKLDCFQSGQEQDFGALFEDIGDGASILVIEKGMRMIKTGQMLAEKKVQSMIQS